jgi:hypothetical protein
MKNLILIIGTLLMALNTLIGLIVIDYATLNFLLADLSIALSVGFMYFVANSKMANGYKIGLTVLFFFTGITRCLCAALAETVWQNNVLLIVVLGILFFELACVASSLFASKKR